MNTDEFKHINEHHGKGVDLQEVYHSFVANKWLLLIILVSSILLSFMYIKKQVPKYKADVLFQVDTKLGGTGMGDVINLSSYGENSPVDTQIALLKSRFILNKVVENLGLDIMVAPIKKSFWKRWFSLFKADKASIDVSKFNVPRYYLNKGFSIVVDSKDHIKLLDYDGHVILSGKVGDLLHSKDKRVNLLISSLSSKNGAQFTLIKHSMSIVTGDLMGRLRIIEQRGAGVHSSTGILNMSLVGTDPNKIVKILNAAVNIAKEQDAKKKAAEASQTLAFLKKQLPITKQELLNAEHKLNKYRAKSGKLNLKFQTQYLLDQFLGFDKRLEELHVEKSNLLKRYTVNHPVFDRLTSDISIIEGQKNKLENILKKLPKAEQKEVNLARDVNVKQTIYLLLLNKIQELEVVKAGTISGVRVLSYAYLPDNALPQKQSPVYVGSFIMGLILFYALVFGRKALSTKVKDPHLLERTIGLPTLAILPFCRESFSSKEKTKRYSLISKDNPRNITVEALRSLRTSLQVVLSSSQNNIISILGLCPSVGKSFVASNFSFLLATAGKKVIILDCDLRAGSMHKYFGISSANGLTEVLNGSLQLSDAIKQSKFNDNLFHLTRGTFPKDPSELLMGPNLKNVLDRLSEEFDIVVIDTPPILLVTDAVIVSGFSAINYLVLGAGEHYLADVEKSIKILKSADVKVQGCIYNFNKFQKRLHGDLYGYRYNSKYYYNSYGHYHKNHEET